MQLYCSWLLCLTNTPDKSNATDSAKRSEPEVLEQCTVVSHCEAA